MAEDARRATPPTAHQQPAKDDHDNSAEPTPSAHPATDDDDDAPDGSSDGAHVPEPTHPQTSQISAESRAYWAPIVAAMPPMTADAIDNVVAILRRIEARRHHTRDTGES